MSLLEPSALKTSLRNGFERCYYFYGKSISDIEITVKYILNKTVKKDDSFNFFEFEGKGFNADEFAAACDALPVFAERTVVTVNDLNAETLGAEQIKRLLETITNLSETNCVIFYNTSIDITDGKRFPTAKNKKLCDAIEKTGIVTQFNLKTPAVLAKEIIRKAAALGSVISVPTAVCLAEVCNCDSLICERECEKLAAFCAGREITAADIDLLTPKNPDSGIFDLTKAVSMFDGARAMRIFRELIFQRIEPIAILYTLSANMLDLYRAKTASLSGRTPSNVKQDFKIAGNKGFTIDYAFRDSRNISIAHLRRCIRILADTDMTIKSFRGDPAILLEEVLVRMIFRD
ncbi:MAG: DNA polymerase III subunit delta [Ruminococcus sp.]|jgi:DNA polymerase-3 subunit delta|nr:DNA polymerase III subunit delta [Ruminococcus sp.]